MSGWLPNWWSTTTPVNSANNSEDDEIAKMEKLQQSLSTLRVKRAKTAASASAQRDQLQAQARQAHGNGERDQAQALLARARAAWSLVERIDVQIRNVEALMGAVENTAIATTAVDAMRQGADVMDSMLTRTTVSDVEQVYLRVDDSTRRANELDRVLGTSLPMMGGRDAGTMADDVQRQMQQWDEANAQTVVFPDTPSTVPALTNKNNGQNIL